MILKKQNQKAIFSYSNFFIYSMNFSMNFFQKKDFINDIYQYNLEDLKNNDKYGNLNYDLQTVFQIQNPKNIKQIMEEKLLYIFNDYQEQKPEEISTKSVNQINNLKNALSMGKDAFLKILNQILIQQNLLKSLFLESILSFHAKQNQKQNENIEKFSVNLKFNIVEKILENKEIFCAFFFTIHQAVINSLDEEILNLSFLSSFISNSDNFQQVKKEKILKILKPIIEIKPIISKDSNLIENESNFSLKKYIKKLIKKIINFCKNFFKKLFKKTENKKNESKIENTAINLSSQTQILNQQQNELENQQQNELENQKQNEFENQKYQQQEVVVDQFFQAKQQTEKDCKILKLGTTANDALTKKNIYENNKNIYNQNQNGIEQNGIKQNGIKQNENQQQNTYEDENPEQRMKKKKNPQSNFEKPTAEEQLQQLQQQQKLHKEVKKQREYNEQFPQESYDAQRQKNIKKNNNN